MPLQSYIDRRNGDEEITYDHPILEDVLHETYGWFLYQEQVIKYFTKLNYSLSEADAVRKILGKKRPEALTALYKGTGEWKGRAYPDMAEKAGVDGYSAKIIWDKLEWFAEYSFNKAHSVAYGIAGFKTAFAKYNGPLFYILDSIEVKPDKTPNWVIESRRRGFKILPPDILLSNLSTDIVGKDILYGLANVNHVGRGAANLIIQLREKYDVSTPDKLREALAGQKELWEQTRDEAKEKAITFRDKSPNMILKSDQITALICAGAFDSYIDDEISLQERQKYEKEYLKVILTDNAFEAFAKNEIELLECVTYEELENAEAGQVVTIPGIISNISETKARKPPHKPMAIVTVEYEDGEAEFIVFDQQLRKYKFLWKERVPGVFELKKTARGISFVHGRKLT